MLLARAIGIKAISSNLVLIKTCNDVLGSLVSSRCAIIAACLVAILLALGILIASDIMDLISIRSNRSTYAPETSGPRLRSETTGWQSVRTSDNNDQMAGNQRWQALKSSSIFEPDLIDRLKDYHEEEEEQEEEDENDNDNDVRRGPDLARQETSRARVEESDTLDMETKGFISSNASDRRPIIPRSPDSSSGPILTRAHFAIAHGGRPQSPLVLVTTEETTSIEEYQKDVVRTAQSVVKEQAPPRGVLKKTSSFQRVNDDSDEGANEPGSGRQSRSSSVTSAKRSLLNVRFADE